MFINYAHRGASAYAPENTMSAFRRALELGAGGIELDLQETRDGKIIIYHDRRLELKGIGTGRICDYTYDQLLTMDFGAWFDPSFSGEPIVLFEDFAREFFSKDITFAIELKWAGFEKKVLNIIKRYPPKHFFITSFYYQALKNMNALDSSVPLSWLISSDITPRNLAYVLPFHTAQICPKAQNATPQGIALARQNGVSVRLWGIYNEEIMKRAYQLDSDGMTVNFPDRLKALMEKQNETVC